MSTKYVIIRLVAYVGVLWFSSISVKANINPIASISVFSDSIINQEIEYNDRYTKRLEKYERAWRYLIPAYAKIQYAGNMGMFSFGTGWQYGKNDQWETDLLFGFIPKHQSKKSKITFTIKQNFIPWKMWKCDKFYFEPLSCGIYLNSVLSDEFWSSAPDKYPNGYYWFSTKVRTNIFIGERFTLLVPAKKREFARSITFFYEVSTHDFAIIQAIKNSRLTPKDYLTLSFGIKFNWL